MIILLGLLLLIAAVVVGTAAVLTNDGSTHALTGQFSVLGYHVTGSTGMLFLDGIVVGAVGLIGLVLVLSSARRTARRGRVARGELSQARHDTEIVGRDRDELAAAQRDGVQSNPQTVQPIPVPTLAAIPPDSSSSVANETRYRS